MSVTEITAVSEQVREALQMVRRYRHQPSCRCGLYQGIWCTPQERTWSEIFNRLIDKAR